MNKVKKEHVLLLVPFSAYQLVIRLNSRWLTIKQQVLPINQHYTIFICRRLISEIESRNIQKSHCQYEFRLLGYILSTLAHISFTSNYIVYCTLTAVYKYTVKKGWRFSRPLPRWQKSLTFFTVYIVMKIWLILIVVRYSWFCAMFKEFSDACI